MQRCAWATTPLLSEYHDTEWGVPQHNDRVLFEFLILEGAQAGLSWETVLRKRARYREVFAGFDPSKVARFRPQRIETLMEDAGIIRNRLKITSAIDNARAFLAVQAEFGSFDAYLWRFVEGSPRVEHGTAPRRTHSKESDTLSKDLRERGFRFVGTTICYALMQAVGLVNDHDPGCFRHAQLGDH